MAINPKEAAKLVYNHCKECNLKKIKEDDIMNILKEKTGDYCFKSLDSIMKILEVDFPMKKQTYNFAAYYKDDKNEKTAKNDHFFNEDYLVLIN